MIAVYRIAAETPTYGAGDLSGGGAKHTGGRWNPKGIAVVYAASSRALACLEVMAHMSGGPALPLNRYLVEITLPRSAWDARVRYPVDGVGWDAEPPGRTSIEWGRAWIESGDSLLAEVPSVVVPEETNILINPAHPDMAAVIARLVRQWRFDGRIRATG